MIVLQIEHLVPDFAGWKKAFDSDPVNRKASGVNRYRIFRQVDNPNYVILELDFNTVADARALLASLEKLWNKVEGSVMVRPQSRIVEAFESNDY